MNWIKTSNPFFILLIIGFWVLVFSICDVIFNKGWTTTLLSLYALIIIIILLILYTKSRKKTTVDTVEEFEKSLKGGLFHFKCPTCDGIFAIKKSKGDNKKTVKMTCPDCGIVGFIPSHPLCIEEEIPEKKSLKASFKCITCGEGVTVWAEGTDLYKGVSVYSCPFCGEQKTLKRF